MVVEGVAAGNVHEGRVLLVGLSGCSSSGKTTLARILRDIWPGAWVLHQDDFYWPDEKIPWKGKVQDWDCLESIDLDKLLDCLGYIKANGTPPDNLQSKEDQNSVGSVNLDASTAGRWKRRAQDLANGTQIVLVDGFLLYSESMAIIRDLFDVKLFLRTDYQTAKQRREARSGYVTIDGFWEDPPGYVDEIVWPNYVRDHAFLFENGNVEGSFDAEMCVSAGVDAVPHSAKDSMSECVQWACNIIEGALNRK